MSLSEYEADIDPTEFDDDGNSIMNSNQVEKVMGCIMNLRATYPTEVSNYTGIDRQKVNHILYELKDKGLLMRLTPTLKNSDARLYSRVGDLHNKGITGIDSFKNMNWFALNTERDWLLKVDIDGDEDFYVDEFHKPVKDPLARPDYRLRALLGEKLDLV